MRFPVSAFVKYLKYLLGLAETLLAIRVIFKILIASPQAIIVELLYAVTDFIARPFRGIFADFYLSNGSVVDLVTISAMIGYPIIAFLLVELVYLLNKESIIRERE